MAFYWLILHPKFGRTIKLKVPSDQIHLPLSLEHPFLETAFTAIKRIGGLNFLVISFILILAGLWRWILVLLILLLLLFFSLLLVYRICWMILNSLLPNLFLKKKQDGLYEITFFSDDDSIFITFSGDSKKSTFFSKLKLKSISVELSRIPKYRLNFGFRFRDFTNSFSIIGNRAEIQWLCDELNEWTGFEIRYLKPLEK